MHAADLRKEKDRRLDSQQIGAVREFNRFYTRQLGLLNKDFLNSEWTLAEVRVLYEISTREGVTARQIANELQLDEAYLSRILSKFQRRRLIKRNTSALDARQHLIGLTPTGHSAYRPLGRSATEQIAQMLAPLVAADRAALVESMARIRRLLQSEPETQTPYDIRPLRIGDIGWITHRQGILYAEEYGWDASYEALVAEILGAFVKSFDPRQEAAWVAEVCGNIVGSVFLVRASALIAQLRLLYVEPSARGLGLGRRLVSLCIEGARERGYRTLTLWTNDVLVAARHIYEAMGFRLTGEERHRLFGKDLVSQTWALNLEGGAGCQDTARASA
jgi:DNA-binding MarR family transcriptional regulator/GNAT superfamily N-acetyltransferase